jgi:Tol biopolymer transport system component
MEFSPDGRWMLFGVLNRDVLQRVPVPGGAPLLVLGNDAELGEWGWDWDGNEHVVYSTLSGLRRATISGGEVEVLTSTGGPEDPVEHRFPQVLPNGRGVLLTIVGGNQLGQTSVAVLDRASGDVRTLVNGARDGRYAPTGHLVYGSEGGLYAVPLNLERLEIAGTPARVVDDVHQNASFGQSFFSFSDTGTLAYLPSQGGSVGQETLSWVDRVGRSEPLPLPLGVYGSPQLSPDGRALAVMADGQVITIDLDTGRRSHVTREGANGHAVWTADGEGIVYGSLAGGAAGVDIYRRKVGGAEPAERLTTATGDENPTSIYGNTLLYMRDGRDGGFDLYTLDLDDPRGSAAPLVHTEAHEANGQFSPDGRWVAYEVWEEGVPEVWVEPYPVDGRRWKFSSESGLGPIWSRADRELFYLEGGRRMMSVRYQVTEDGELAPETPEELFERELDSSGYPERLFDVTPDGQRFVVNDAQDTSRDELVVVENWFEELKRLVPVD